VREEAVSRVGKKPIPIPLGVQVRIEGSTVTVTGPKGTLTQTFHPSMQISIEDGHLVVRRPSDDRKHKALHGLTRALLANMVTGVTQGFQQHLRIEGVGYRAEPMGKAIVLYLGYSHPIIVEPPEGITFEVNTRDRIITVSGIDKQQVGQVAAKIRALRPPEPYKGKGIRYTYWKGDHWEDEPIRRKAGKAGKAK
jgi:large subunit ribosomal protein L6